MDDAVHTVGCHGIVVNKAAQTEPESHHTPHTGSVWFPDVSTGIHTGIVHTCGSWYIVQNGFLLWVVVREALKGCSNPASEGVLATANSGSGHAEGRQAGAVVLALGSSTSAPPPVTYWAKYSSTSGGRGPATHE